MFSKTEINTGRQIEFDYLKGWFIPLILLIHSFQLMGGQAAETPAYKVIYIAATMTGSAIFLFVLGLGSTYSKRSAWQQIGYGVKLIILEFLWNALALAAPLLLGMGLRQVASAETNWDAVFERIPMYLQYINIFFIAGVCYLLIALLRCLKMPTWGYFLLALFFMIVNPFLYMNGKSTGYELLDYVLATFAGGRPGVSLCTLAHIPYALLGVGFGKLLRLTENKGRLYASMVLPLCGIIIAYLIYSFSINTGLNEWYAYARSGYVYPGTLKALANCACVLLTAAAMYAVRNWIVKLRPLHNALLHFSRWNTPYYAVHPFYYSLLSALVLLAPVSASVCLLLTPVNWLLCYVTICIYKRIKNRYKTRFLRKTELEVTTDVNR